MSDLLCLPQSPRMDLYSDVSDVKPFSRINRTKIKPKLSMRSIIDERTARVGLNKNVGRFDCDVKPKRFSFNCSGNIIEQGGDDE